LESPKHGDNLLLENNGSPQSGAGGVVFTALKIIPGFGCGKYLVLPFCQKNLSLVKKISAVTLRVADMDASVRFYKDVLELEIIYGGEGSYFTSLRTKDGDTILNLEHGNVGIQWGG
jgi:glyoxalase/bleomycin resistance protein/dioxygenase superfamily protein